MREPELPRPLAAPLRGYPADSSTRDIATARRMIAAGELISRRSGRVLGFAEAVMSCSPTDTCIASRWRVTCWQPGTRTSPVSAADPKRDADDASDLLPQDTRAPRRGGAQMGGVPATESAHDPGDRGRAVELHSEASAQRFSLLVGARVKPSRRAPREVRASALWH